MTNASSIDYTLDSYARGALASSVDIILGLRQGSSTYLNGTIVYLVVESVDTVVLASSVFTTFRLSTFPEQAADAPALYEELTSRLTAALYSGNFTAIYNSQLRKALVAASKDESVLAAISTTSFSNVTFSPFAFVSPPSYSTVPTQAPSTSSEASAVSMSNAEMSVIIVGAFLGIVIIGLCIFSIGWYVRRLFNRYHQKKCMREGEDISCQGYGGDVSNRDDIDLDKLDYIADVMQSKI